MTTPENGSASTPVEPDGERFLQDLDAALQGHEPDGAHAGTARFAAQLAGVLQSQESSAPENLRQRIDIKPRVSKQALKGSTVVRVDHALRRYRLGLLDVAAIVALTVFGVLIWRSLRTETIAQPEIKSTTDADRLAAEDEKPPSQPRTPPTVKQIEEEPWKKEIHAKLARKVPIDFVDTPFEEVVGFIRAACGVSIIVDPKSVATGVLASPITLRSKDITLEAALKWVAKLAGAQVTLRNNCIFISQTAIEPLEMRVLDVKALPMKSEFLAELLQLMPFDPPFSPDTGASVEGFGGLLKVSQTRESHNRIFALIASIRDQTASGKIECQPELLPEWKKELRKKLQRKVSFEFMDTDFVEAIRFLQSLTGATFVIDSRIIAAGTPNISLKVTEMDAELALSWLMRLADVEYAFENEAIFVSKGIATPPVLVGYNVSRISRNHNLPEKEIERMVETSVAPDKWDPALGNRILCGEGWIFVVQQREIQLEVESLLQKLENPEKP